MNGCSLRYQVPSEPGYQYRTGIIKLLDDLPNRWRSSLNAEDVMPNITSTYAHLHELASLRNTIQIAVTGVNVHPDRVYPDRVATPDVQPIISDMRGI